LYELDQTGDSLVALKMSDIDTFDSTRQFGQFQDLLQPGQTFLRIDVKHFGLSMTFQITSQTQILERVDLITQSRRLFELQFSRSLLHVFFHFLQKTGFAAVEEQL
jgi:hypothetical protein